MARVIGLRGFLLGSLAALVVAGCADTSSDDGDGATAAKQELYTAGVVGRQPEPGEPKDGGTLTIADYAEARSLDPTLTPPNGAAGGSALAAVYDVLMEYDRDAGEWTPRLAKSLVTDDSKVWELSLREGVRFTDGTALDADAVVGSIGYYMEHNGFGTQNLRANGVRAEATGDLTVRFTLERPWVNFPNALATGPGMILAPVAYRGGQEKFQPIGAGPFKFGEHKPAEELRLLRNDDYWQGAPHLDALRFVWPGADSAKLDAFRAGDVDMANMRDGTTVEAARRDQIAGLMTPSGLGRVILVNNREGRPGHDPRIRRAINLAIDPQVVLDRAYGGAGFASRNLFAPSAPYFTEVDLPDVDVAEAKRLVAEAKADGVPTSMLYVGQADQPSTTAAVTIQAMLESIGLEVEVETVKSVADQTQRMFVTRDFDMVMGAMSVPEEDPHARLATGLLSDSPQNPMGYQDAEMDTLLNQLQTVSGDEATEVLRAINEHWQKTLPGVALADGAFLVTWQQNVHGVTGSSDMLLFFSQAWKA